MKSSAFRSARGRPPSVSSAYNAVAEEYYDQVRHPTCSNFREASKLPIFEWLRQSNVEELIANTLFSEIGAGASIVGEYLSANVRTRLDNLLLVDASERMLAYSSVYKTLGAHLVVADAIALPLKTASVGYFVISLGDPFNHPLTWKEVHRCLRPGGQCLFTTPSYEWALGYRTARSKEREDFAFFELRDGHTAYLPSLVYPPERQAELFNAAGLSIIQTRDVLAKSLRSPLSPKLAFKPHEVVRSPVTAYLIQKEG
jgi:SAM-dependent methyltransferase